MQFLKWLNNAYIVEKYINAGMNAVMLKNLGHSDPEADPQTTGCRDPNPRFSPGALSFETKIRNGNAINQQRFMCTKVGSFHKAMNRRPIPPPTSNMINFRTSQRLFGTFCRRLVR
ncbi:hypothetical protein TWF694_000859 [Orbilia ellipsospora]|uniref:Uncharacterized protein n=1 Tax=Orbilia ellipsospora TaxID=2528407 RepID=A0AAV9XRD9_9PEZI